MTAPSGALLFRLNLKRAGFQRDAPEPALTTVKNGETDPVQNGGFLHHIGFGSTLLRRA